MTVNPIRTDRAVAGGGVPGADDWRRLSPRMLLVHPVKEMGRALPALVAVLIAGSSAGDGGLWGLVGAAIVSALSLTRWFTTRFRVGADQVQIREGLLRRRTLAARLDRVRTVDVTSHALHRALGLARVEIGTGVSDRKGASILRLDGLPTEEAARLRGELLHRAALPTGPGPSPADAGVGLGEPGLSPVDPRPALDPGAASPSAPAAFVAEETEIARLRPDWLRFAPFTLSGVFTGLAIAGFGWRIVSEGQVDVGSAGPVHSIAGRIDAQPVWLSVVEAVAAGVLFVAVASTVGYLLAYWDFRLSRHRGGSFQVSRGLLTTRATSIEVSRLRGVGISESLLVRMVGGARTIAIATGLDNRRNGPAGRSGTVLLPDAPLAEAQRVAGAVVGRPDVVTAALQSHGPVARRRRFTRAFAGAVAFAVVFAVGWRLASLPGHGWLFGLVVFALVPALGADRARNLGSVVRDGFLVVQSGSLTRRRAVLEADAIIGWNIRQSFFQRRAGVATLVATTAAGRQSYRLIDLTLPETRRRAEAGLPGLLDDFTA